MAWSLCTPWEALHSKNLAIPTCLRGWYQILTFFHEEISFPNFAERSVPELPLAKLCTVPFALQNRALFEAEKNGENVPRKRGGRGVASKWGKKEKRMRENRSGYASLDLFLGILGASGRDTVPLRNPKGTSRKACLENP